MRRVFLLMLVSLSVAACAVGNPRLSELEPLGAYDAVMIEPVKVSFAENWEPKHANSRLDFSEQEIDRVRDRVASIFDSRFRTTLEKRGINVVDQAGPGVLKIRPELRKVYLYAPLPESIMGTIHVRRVGSMQLHAEFIDVDSGETIVVLQDDKRGRDQGYFHVASTPTNRFQLHQMFDDWALVIAEEMLEPRYATN